EHRVLRRGDELHPGRLDVLAPPRPRLVGHLMPPGSQARPERQHRKRVPRLAERAEEEAEGGGGGALRGPLAAAGIAVLPQPASSATARSCSIRSSTVNAIGVIISVPTPASRNAARRSRTTSRG